MLDVGPLSVGIWTEIAVTRLVLIGVFSLVLLGAVPVPASDAESILDKRLSIQLKGVTCLYVISTLRGDFQVPIGYERRPNEPDASVVNIDIEQGTLRDVLDALVAQEPAYEWRFRDGVINIAPARDRSPVLAAILDAQVDTFIPAANIDRHKLSDSILALPAVSNVLLTYRAEPSPLPDVISTRENLDATRVVAFSMSNSSVRTILNALIRDTSLTSWTLSVSRGKRPTIILGLS